MHSQLGGAACAPLFIFGKFWKNVWRVRPGSLATLCCRADRRVHSQRAPHISPLYRLRRRNPLQIAADIVGTGGEMGHDWTH